MANKIDVINAYFIGYKIGKWHGNDIEVLLGELNLTKAEWVKLKSEYPVDIDKDQLIEIDRHFGLNEVC